MGKHSIGKRSIPIFPFMRIGIEKGEAAPGMLQRQPAMAEQSMHMG